jgi:hypothetical protein
LCLNYFEDGEISMKTLPGAATVLLAALLVPADCKAEMIELGTFKPKLTLFGAVFEPTVNARGDVITTRAAANAKLDAEALIPRAELVEKTRQIIRSFLPRGFKDKGGSCTLNVTSLETYDVRVSGNTGFLDAAVWVDPEGCNLFQGRVSMHARFVPRRENDKLGIDITRLDVEIPPYWSAPARLVGRDPRKEIAEQITKEVAGSTLKMPTFEGGRAAFQAASLDARGQSIVLRIRADAQVDQPRVAKFLTGWEPLKNLAYSHP